MSAGIGRGAVDLAAYMAARGTAVDAAAAGGAAAKLIVVQSARNARMEAAALAAAAKAEPAAAGALAIAPATEPIVAAAAPVVDAVPAARRVAAAASATTGTAGAVAGSRSIVSIFTDAVGKFADRNAYMFQDPATKDWKHMTFAEAGTRAEHIGEGLLQLGVQKGDRLAILSGSSVDWGLTDYAALGTGSVVVPIYQTNAASEVLHALNDSGAKTVVVEDAEQLAKVRSVMGDLRVKPEIIVMKPSAETAGVKTLAEVEEAGKAAAGKGAWRAQAKTIGSDDLATIIYTSGTTGAPKGSMLSHGNYTGVVDALAGADNLFTPDDRVDLFLPMAHTFARSINFAGAATGMEVAFSNPKTVIEDLKVIQPTVLPSVPRIFEKYNAGISEKVAALSPFKRWVTSKAIPVGQQHYEMTASGQTPGAWLDLKNSVAHKVALDKLGAQVADGLGGRLRMAFSGGAPLDRGIQARFGSVGVPIYDAYGMTEAPAIAMNLPGASKLGTVGRKVRDSEVRIAEGGELQVKGPQVFQGYWSPSGGTPEDIARIDKANAETFTADGWLRTGDQAEIGADGMVRITGRLKDLIKTAGGKYVAPAMFETTMKGSPYVSQAMMYGDGKPFITAMVTLNEPAVREWAKGQGIAADAVLADEPRVHALINEAVQSYNGTVSPPEGVKRFRILTSDLSQDAGEITPTLKVKRGVVSKLLKPQLEAMYADGAPAMASISRDGSSGGGAAAGGSAAVAAGAAQLPSTGGPGSGAVGAGLLAIGAGAVGVGAAAWALTRGQPKSVTQ